MTVSDGGIDRYAEIAREIATAPGLQGPPGDNFTQAGDLCVHSQQHNLSLPIGAPPAEMFSFIFAPGDLDGTEDFIKLDFMTYSDGPLINPWDTLSIEWDGIPLEIGISGAPTTVRMDSSSGQTTYSVLLSQTDGSNAAWNLVEAAGNAKNDIIDIGVSNWMAAGGILTGTFTKGDAATTSVAKLFLWIYKVVGP